MADNRRFNVAFRRKREGKTDYRLRRLLLASGKPRLVVRKTIHHLIAQLILYNPSGDKVIATATTQELKKHGWNANNLPAAYLLGIIIAKKARSNHLKEAILDAGLHPSIKGSKIYAVVQGAIDAGFHIPHSKEVLPPPARIQGEHIKKENALKQEKFRELKAKLLQ